MIVSITGTPGTGKSTVGDILRSRGHNVIELGEFIKENELYGELDEERGSYDVDPEELDVVLKQKLPGGTVLLVGHLSHLVSVDVVIVLRCRPSVLASRLSERGYSRAKVKENMEAEGCDVILIESTELVNDVCEIDTTELSPEKVAGSIEEILEGEREKYAIGHVDWSDEVLGWF